jgi:hypothetical protein
VLHVLNGDATAAVFPDTLPGERAVWRDILMEGPADADAETRAAWLAPRLGVGVDDYARRWREGQRMLADAKAHAEVVLWFEQDLFCATNLWFVLDRLDAARVSLVFPPLSAGGGLGALAPAAFAPLFEQRRVLTARDIADARALWRAYAAPEPLPLTRLQPTLPFAPAAVRLHCARFPSVVDGLDDVEHAALGALDEPLAFGTLFRRVTTSAGPSELGLGDVQFAASVRDLAAGSTPLLAIEHRDQPFARWRIQRTSVGADVLGGRADRLALVPLDRWLGGVHLRGGAARWRWDRQRRTLVAA